MTGFDLARSDDPKSDEQASEWIDFETVPHIGETLYLIPEYDMHGLEVVHVEQHGAQNPLRLSEIAALSRTMPHTPDPRSLAQ